MELTEEVTPLEAGLHGAVSLAKGCYIGQETLAKVRPARLQSSAQSNCVLQVAAGLGMRLMAELHPA